MSNEPNLLMPIVEKDPRFKPSAYEFLFEALEYTRDRLTKERGTKIKHVTGGELLEGLKLLAIDQFGRMAKTVLNQWGVFTTLDIGEMVFNLVDSGCMEKTEQDCRGDFDDVFDFDEAFCRGYKIEIEDGGC